MFDAREVRTALDAVGPQRLAVALGVRRFKLERGGRELRACCPIHGGDNPSAFSLCEVDGRLLWNCHTGCGRGGDALDLVASVHGLDVQRDFVDVLGHAAAIAGVHADSTENTRAKGVVERPQENVEPSYPPESEVAALWSACGLVGDHEQVVAYLESRALPIDRLEDNDLSRALPVGGDLPSWARCRGRDWRESGHHVVVPVFDGAGRMRSLRAWRIVDNDFPKRLPPAGLTVRGLVMADALGRRVLESGAMPEWWPAGASLEVVIAEGEPNFLSWATRAHDAAEVVPAVFGIVAGSWTAAIAARIPDGARIALRTDDDAVGEKYAAAIARTLHPRCPLCRRRAA